MIRRQFIKNCALSAVGSLLTTNVKIDFKNFRDVIVGHNSHQYKIDLDWGLLESNLHPVKDCHEMVQDSKGRILLLTNHTKNNVIVYDKSGNYLESWGTNFPGAHGLTLNKENGSDFLYISDTERNELIKTTIDGKVVKVFPFDMDSNLYESKSEFKPTETAVAKNGDVYIADGYGKQYIHHYNANAELINVFGGHGKEDAKFTNAHGIAIDNRDGNEKLLITDRMKNQLKSFSMEGKLLSVIDLPGAYICRPVLHGNNIYLATIWSGKGNEGTGFISILNEENKLISAPCGSTPNYIDGTLEPMYQTLKIFSHPHDVCIDDEENLYIAQWNAGQSYPIKMYRI